MKDELKARALRLLARREHTRAELARKLAPLAESSTKLDELLALLEARSHQSDERYAEERSRKLARKYGAAWIHNQLCASGVSRELADRAVAVVREGELERARALLARKYPLPATAGKEVAKRARFLLRRGYSSATVGEVLKGVRSLAR